MVDFPRNPPTKSPLIPCHSGLTGWSLVAAVNANQAELTHAEGPFLPTWELLERQCQTPEQFRDASGLHVRLSENFPGKTALALSIQQ
jgi:hypothetical protein